MREGERKGADAPSASSRAAWVTAAQAFAVYAFLAAIVYAPALSGPFVSDDYDYVVANHDVRGSEPGWLPALLDPYGNAALQTANYAPVAMLAHALEWRLFRDDVRPYHLVNLVMHALVATLLVGLLRASRVPRLPALAAGALFVVHPANVEAVAWISQLKSILGLGFALGALLAFRRRPLASVLLFGLAVLAKSMAAFAIPAAVTLAFVWRRQGMDVRRHGLALGLWLLLLVLQAMPQSGAFVQAGLRYESPYADVGIQLRSIAGIGARYLVMAATGFGVSAFHEPPPATSWLDPWWCLGLLLGAVLVARIAIALRRGREEAAWWIGAAAAFAPISQVFPFFYGMGDRYLYFILPGLMGGTLLFGEEVGRAASRRAPAILAGRRRLLRAGAFGAFLLVGLQFAVHSERRAGLWTSEYSLLMDSASQYPDGATAYFVRALIATRKGDTDRAFEYLEAATDRGFGTMRSYQLEPGLAPLRGDPRFHALLVRIARLEVRLAEERGLGSRRTTRSVAAAHFFLGDHELAIQILEDELREGGSGREGLLADLEWMRREQSRLRGRGAGPGG